MFYFVLFNSNDFGVLEGHKTKATRLVSSTQSHQEKHNIIPHYNSCVTVSAANGLLY